VDSAFEVERIRPARADDRAAARQDARDLLRAEIFEDRLDEAAPALAHRHRLPAGRVRPPHDRADDRVEPRTVAAAGKDADAVRHPYVLADQQRAGLRWAPQWEQGMF